MTKEQVIEYEDNKKLLITLIDDSKYIGTINAYFDEENAILIGNFLIPIEEIKKIEFEK